MIVSPKRVLWPTDFSELSLHAGRYARGFCEVFGSELHIVHVIPPPLGPDVSVMIPAEVPMTVSEQELIEASRRGLEKLIAEHIAKTDKPVVSDAFFGTPWHAICAYARDKAIDLIVIATHGRTGLSHVLIGSTAERVVQHAPCPVLTVKHGQREFLRT